MTTTVYGTKYETTKGLSTTEIAKRVRADIKELGLPKGVKTSVKTRYFSGGSSLDVEVTALPDSIPVWNPEYLLAKSREEHYGRGFRHYSDALAAIVKSLEEIVNSYNYDGSDAMTDYFHVRFYGHVKVDWELERAREAGELEAAKAAETRKVACDAAVRAFCKALYDLAESCVPFEPDLSGLTRRTSARDLPAVRFHSLKGNYGEHDAHITTAVFEAHGLTHVARRFWRADVPTTGKIELYTVEPGTTTETFFRYVNEFEPSKVDITAIRAIEAESVGHYHAPASLDFVTRAGLLELR